MIFWFVSNKSTLFDVDDIREEISFSWKIIICGQILFVRCQLLFDEEMSVDFDKEQVKRVRRLW